MDDLEQQRLEQIVKSAGITEAQKATHGESMSYRTGYKDAMDNEGDDMSWLKTHWSDGEESHQYRRGYADGIKDWNDGVREGIDEANPDGTIGDDEQERIAELMATFESELDDLLGWAMKTAEEIGGQFRAPGIQQSIRKLIKQKHEELLQARGSSGDSIEWLQRLPISQGGDMPDDEWQAAQDRK